MHNSLHLSPRLPKIPSSECCPPAGTLQLNISHLGAQAQGSEGRRLTLTDGEGWGLLRGSRQRLLREPLVITSPCAVLAPGCLLYKTCLPLCQEELERTLVLEWLCFLGETPEAEAAEYPMRARALRPFTSF